MAEYNSNKRSRHRTKLQMMTAVRTSQKLGEPKPFNPDTCTMAEYREHRMAQYQYSPAVTIPRPEPPPKMYISRLGQLDLRIADCQTRRKAAIMRAARAVEEPAGEKRYNGLQEIALHIQRQLDNHLTECEAEGMLVNDSYHIRRFNPLVSRGQLKAWVGTLRGEV